MFRWAIPPLRPFCAAAAEAATFDFSYELQSGEILAGSLDGTLQADSDTVIVSSVFDVTFAGGPALTFPILDSITNNANGADPVVSLSGTFLDTIACTSTCDDGFLFDTSGSVFGIQIFSIRASAGQCD